MKIFRNHCDRIGCKQQINWRGLLKLVISPLFCTPADGVIWLVRSYQVRRLWAEDGLLLGRHRCQLCSTNGHGRFDWSSGDVIIGAMTSQITNLKIVYSTVYTGADQSKHQSSASLAFVLGIHRSPVNSPRKGPITWKMFLFDDVIMIQKFLFALIESLIDPDLSKSLRMQ